MLVALAGVASANPPKDFWRVFVKAHKPWVLKSKFKDEKTKISVETYDIRKVGTADVARLRWTETYPGQPPREMGASDCHWTQVAVTDAGMYLFMAEDDDAKILAALKGKPHRASPPKSYSASKTNKGRYLTAGDDKVCWGWENVSGEECADTCTGEVCATADGIAELTGTCAPNMGMFER
jgi:hypothetical protein